MNSRMSRQTIVSGAVGNAMEWYDFALYGSFATVISGLFFPSDDKLASLLATFAVFAGGFLMRPLGAIIFGTFGDRSGRKNTLAATVILMAIPTFLIGVLPTHAQIGVSAAALLVAVRLVQGLSAGGEAAGSYAFLIEHAPATRRGFAVSWAPFTAVGGMLLGSGIATLLAATLSTGALDAWGWRVAFLFGGSIGIVGMLIRRRAEETPKFAMVQERGEVARAPVAEALGECRREIGLGIALVAGNAVAFYTLFTYMPTYLASVAGMPLSQALQINTIGMIVLVVLTPLVGALSDRVGRKPLIVASFVAFVVLSYPLFLLTARGEFFLSLLVQVIFAVLVVAITPTLFAIIAESFPTRLRYSAHSITHNVSAAIFGGTAPFIATYLVRETGQQVSPSYYLIAIAVVSLVAAMATRDRFREPLA